MYERLKLLSEIELDPEINAVDLVEKGLCDPVRLFVKQEPHPKKKIDSRRFRLISSVSVIDQIVERVLFGYQNRLEIAMWKTCPSKPGMGLSVATQAKAIWDDLKYKHTTCPAAEADISGFDWSVQAWELEADVEMRISLGDFNAKTARAARNRFKCLSLSVFQLSNGRLIAQAVPGLMKSGSYCTSSSNSRIRCLMAKLIGSPWCIAMGDDSVEGFVPNAQLLYEKLGHNCKDYILCDASFSESGTELCGVNFCSHYISENNYFLTSWAKTLFKYLGAPKPEFESLAIELSNSPQWRKISKYVCRVGLGPDKRLEKEQNGQTVKTSRQSSETLKKETAFSPTFDDTWNGNRSSSCQSRLPVHQATIPDGNIFEWNMSNEGKRGFPSTDY